MRGIFGIMILAGAAASSYAGYRAMQSRKARRNRTGLPEAELTPEERQEAIEALAAEEQRTETSMSGDAPSTER